MRAYLLLPLAVAALLAGCDSGAGTSSAVPPSSRPVTQSPTARALTGKVIVIDPGHNGGNASHPQMINRKVNVVNGRKPCNTTGTATNDGYAEHAFTWDVANR